MLTSWYDLQYAFRLLRRTPGFTTVAVLTLGLGIGASTAIYTVVYGVLLRPLPYPDPDRIVRLFQVNERTRVGTFSDPNFEDVRTQSRSFQALAEFYAGDYPVSVGATAMRLRAAWVSREIFGVVRVQPRLGRTFVPEEQREDGPPAALVAHGFWQSQLGGDADLSGKSLTLNGKAYPIVGVMPPGFGFPSDAQVWVPRELEGFNRSRTSHNNFVVGRLRDGVTLDQARGDVHALAARLKQQYGDTTWMDDVAVVPMHEQMVGRVRRLLLILLGAVGFLLLVACANVVNLLLTRATARQRELALRAALGASRARLLAPFLAESFLLTMAGGALGVILAIAGVGALLRLEPGGLPRLREIAVSWPVLGFALGLCAATALLLGVVAALRAMRADVYDRLKEGGRAHSGGGSGARLRNVLVVAQLAVSLVLLVGAGLLGRSFVRLMQQDTGFRMQRMLTMDLSSPFVAGDEAQRRIVRFHEEVEARLRALPGVSHVGGIDSFPFQGSLANGSFLILDNVADIPKTWDEFGERVRNKERAGSAEFRVVTQGYFETMGIALRRGRLFEERDTFDAPHVAVITESLAKTRWPDRDPIGLAIEFGNMDGDVRPFTIVGIAADIRDRGVDQPPRPTFYTSARQRPSRTWQFTFALHGPADPATLIAPAREVVRALDPEVPQRFRTIEQVVATALADRRFMLLLLSVFAGAALLLAVIGIYGVMSYVVSQRTQEMGIRVALGARPGDIERLVLGQGARLVLVGLALGFAGAVLLTRLLATMLYEVTATDPLTYASVAGVLAVAAVVACQIPAWRATRVDPLTALRAE